MHFLTTHLSDIFLGLEWTLRLIALFVVPRRRPPASGTAWLLVIFLFPLPGWLVFLVLGNFKLPKSRQDIQTAMNEEIDQRLANIKQTDANGDRIIDPQIPAKYQSLENLTQEYGRLPSLAANGIDIITGYHQAIDSIVADITNAEQSVYLEYFILAMDRTTEPLFEALEAAKLRGVDVRVLFDAWGSLRYPKRAKMSKRLKQAGIAYHSMLPLRLPGRGYVRPDLRNHRKVVIVDHKIGYTGSQNLVNRSYNRRDGIAYDELVVRVTGPVVFQLNAIFMTDWVSENGRQQPTSPDISVSRFDFPGSIMQLLPSGPGFADENNLKVFTHLFHLADKTITIVNPYFVPPESLLGALLSAAKRGVRVRMVNSKAIDQWMVGYAQRSFYDALLDAGVELFLYHKPNLLHSKFIVVDDEVCVVGSSNLDIRSFELDSELSLICYDELISTELSSVAGTYMAHSDQLTRDHWQKRPLYKHFIENIARLTSSVQ